MAEEEGRWAPAEWNEFSPGDRVRVTHRQDTDAVYLGEVVSQEPTMQGLDVRHLESNATYGKQAGQVELFMSRYRTFERWVPVATGHTWVPVNSRDLRPGDYAKGTASDGRNPIEGTVERITTMGFVKLTHRAGRLSPERRWYRSVTPPVTVEPAPDTWERVEDPTTLTAGEYVRALEFGADSPDARVWREGRVEEVTETDVYGHRYVRIYVPGTGVQGCEIRRPYFRRVQAATAPEYTWEPIEGHALREGMYVRGTVRPEETGEWGNAVVEGHVTHFMDDTLGRYLYLDNSAIRGRAKKIDIRTWERRVPREAPAGEVAQENTAPALAPPRVGEYFTRTFDNPNERGRGQCRVIAVNDHRDGWAVSYRQGEGPVRSNLVVRRDGTVYDRRDPHRWPGRFVREAAPSTPEPVLDVHPLPEWATSLDAARRYVHAEAIRLYTTNANCWDGTHDFLEAADLPTERDWPVPPPVDETAEIRAFLNQAREAALSTASDHGKSRVLVEEWLTRHGLNAPPPPPVEYTFTVTAPAGTTREDIINSARQLGQQGWEIN